MTRIVCEWSLAGIEAWSASATAFVIVDVLSFSTAVSVATERGAAVIPFSDGDGSAAADEAARHGAIVAMPRRAAGGQFSLSPASLMRLDPGQRVLLPSPNGSRLSLTTGDVPTFAGCLRNAAAVARAADAAAHDGTVVVIPAGERWPDGTLRPAIEDWLGAGAIVAASRAAPDAEAALAATTFRAAQSRLADLMRDSRSGRELAGWGYAEDVAIASTVNTSDTAPVLRDGMYQAA